MSNEHGPMLALANELASDVAIDHAPAKLITALGQGVSQLEFRQWVFRRRHRGGRMGRRFGRREQQARLADEEKRNDTLKYAGRNGSKDA